MTRHFELGRVFYEIAKTTKPVLVEKKIICPKCKKDISEGKCMAKSNYFMMSIIAANIFQEPRKKHGGLPHHLQGSVRIRNQDLKMFEQFCKARLKLVDKF